MAIPGLGPFIAAGPIMAALAGAGVVGKGIIKKGGVLLSVHSDNSEWTKKAKSVFERMKLSDISSTGEANADIKSTVGITKEGRPARTP